MCMQSYGGTEVLGIYHLYHSIEFVLHLYLWISAKVDWRLSTFPPSQNLRRRGYRQEPPQMLRQLSQRAGWEE